MSTELEAVQTAIAEFDKVGAGIAELNKCYAGVVYAVTTAKGMGEAIAARAAIRAPRIAIEKTRKEAKAPILELGRKLDSEAKRIEGELLKLEEPIDQQIKTEEARKEAVKQAAIDAENTRVARIQTIIDEIRELPLSASGKTASHAQGVLNEAEATVITEEQYQEFFQVAQSALYASIISLKGVVSERMAHEAEQQRIQQEHLELVKFRAAEELRQKAERERIAEESRKQREEAARLAAENAKAEAALKAQRDELDRREQEANASRLAEDARVQKLQEDESNRLAAEREQLERERAELSAPRSGTAQTAGDIMADTNDIQARLPAALVGGRMDSSTGAMAANVITATAINADAITADGAIDDETFDALQVEMISIPKAEYVRLLRKADILDALESAGVDNRQGYDDAMGLLE